MLLLKDRLPDTHDLLRWKWTRGAATLKAEFGDPLTATNYALCLYDESANTPTLKLASTIPAGGTCAGKPCWKETARGFKYVNKQQTPDGIAFLSLKEGLEGFAQIVLKGIGANLRVPPLPLDQDSKVTVQLRNDLGTCWGATYSAPAIRDTQVEFRGKSD